MNFFNILATAAASAQEGKTSGGSALLTFAPFIIIIVVMFFMTARAQKKQKARQEEMMNKLVKGTKVILNSGIIGTIYEVQDKFIRIELNANCVIEVLPQSVMQIVPEEENKENNK